MDKVIQFLSDHRSEIAVVGLATIATQFFIHHKNNQIRNQSKSLNEQLIKVRQKKFTQLKKKQGPTIPQIILNSQNSLIDQIQYLYCSTSRIQLVPHLMKQIGSKQIQKIVSPLLFDGRASMFSGKGNLPKQSFIYKGSYVLTKNSYASTKQLKEQPTEWLMAGPRKYLYFQPQKVKAAIVTCGGLCPGLNVVIRQLYINLSIHYGCPQIWGIHFGYGGMYSNNWNLQFLGGTFLGSSRGGFDAPKMVEGLQKRQINQVYIIGGDGTQRGAHLLHQSIKTSKLDIALIGIPKTIDNDIPVIDKSFGFQTAVSQSIRAIRSAYVQSTGVQHGIGLVRLMGRDAGFIAMEATNSSRDVDVCLIPQAKFNIYGPHGLLQYVYKQLKKKKHLVIVVAEGAGNGVQDLSMLKEAVVKDDSGNIKLTDIGAFLKDEIVKYCKGKGLQATLKYIDPTYMIRTVAANSYDVRMCAQLAAAAVHGGMAGFTGFLVGHVNNALAMIPVETLFGKKGVVDIKGRQWQRTLAGTGQPQFSEPEVEEQDIIKQNK